MTSNVTRFAIDVGEVLLGGDPTEVAKARNKRSGLLPPMNYISVVLCACNSFTITDM